MALRSQGELAVGHGGGLMGTSLQEFGVDGVRKRLRGADGSTAAAWRSVEIVVRGAKSPSALGQESTRRG